MSTFQPPPGPPGPGYGPTQPQYGPPQGIPPQPFAPQPAAPFHAPPQSVPPQPGQPQGPPPQALADPGMRLLARFIDQLILSVLLSFGVLPVLILSRKIGLVYDEEVPLYLGALAWVLLIGLLYEPLTTARGGGPGKAICGLRVVRLETGRKIGFGTALGRWLAYLGLGMVPILGLVNVLSCTWNAPFRQCFHDKAAKTVVLKRQWQ
ncbi:RDD family protein [Streptomyces sp. NPDC048638]|uniref:RDD family protein n=1 Tax=Streptomyces sp. NPDC048638 TaxID=3365580 RepID=UPI00371E7DF2